MVFGMMLVSRMIASWLGDWWLWVPVLVGLGAAHAEVPHIHVNGYESGEHFHKEEMHIM